MNFNINQLSKTLFISVIILLKSIICVANDTDNTLFYWVSDKTGTDDTFLKKYGPDSQGECLHYLSRVDGLSLQRQPAVGIGNAMRNNTENWQGFVDYVAKVNPDIVLGMNSGLMNKSWAFDSRETWSKSWAGDVGLIVNAKAAGIKKVIMFMQSPLSKGQKQTFDPTQGGADLNQRILDCVEYADFVEATKPDGITVTYGLIDAHPAKSTIAPDDYHKAYVDLVKAFKAKNYVLEEIQIDMKTQTVNNSANKLMSACKRAYTEILQQTGEKVRLSWYTWNGGVDNLSDANNMLRNAFENIAQHPDRKYITGLLLDGNNENRSGITDLIPTDQSQKYTITARLNEAFSILEYLEVLNPTQKGDPILGSNNTSGSIKIPKAKPDNVSVTNVSKNSLKISWEDNIQNETGFVIERSTDDNPAWETLKDIQSNTTLYRDENLKEFTKYYYRLKAKYKGDTLSNATNPVIGRTSKGIHQSLQNGWTGISLGDSLVSLSSTSFFSNDTLIIDAGDGDFWTEKDRGHFVYRPMTGNGYLIAQLTNFEHAQTFSMAGLMMRETLDEGAKMTSMLLVSDPGPILRDRTITNGSVNQKPFNKTGEKAPYWVKIERVDHTFSGYISPDGTSWKLIRSISIPMNKDIYVGFVGTTHTNTSIGNYGFTNISYKLETSNQDIKKETIHLTYNKQKEEISIKSLNSYPVNVCIYDLSGKLVLSTKTRTQSIDVSHLKVGQYIVSVHNKTFNATKIFTK